MFRENLTQQVRLTCSGTHPLCVNRIKGAQSVADSDKALDRSHLFIVTLHASGKSMMRNRAELLCLFYDSPREIGVQLPWRNRGILLGPLADSHQTGQLG